MESRAEKYYTDDYIANDSSLNSSRSSRNSRLYRQVYGRYGDLDNLPIDDNTDEIDMDKLKELVSNRPEVNRTPPSGYNFDISKKRKRNIDEQKVYDINKLLEKAKYENNKLKEPEDKIIKTSRNILSTLESTELSVSDIKKACQKYEESKIDVYPKVEKKEESDIKENGLSMTREMKYQTRQISVDPLIEQVMPDNDLSLDLLSDLKPTGDTIVTKPIKDPDKVSVESNIVKKNSSKEQPFFQSLEDTSDIDIIKKDKGIDADFFTNSYQFSKKDFADDDEDFFDEPKTHNILKVLLLILAILVFAGVIFYFVLNYGIGA